MDEEVKILDGVIQEMEEKRRKKNWKKIDLVLVKIYLENLLLLIITIYKFCTIVL